MKIPSSKHTSMHIPLFIFLSLNRHTTASKTQVKESFHNQLSYICYLCPCFIYNNFRTYSVCQNLLKWSLIPADLLSAMLTAQLTTISASLLCHHCQNSVLIGSCLTVGADLWYSLWSLIYPVQLSVNSLNLLHATLPGRLDKFNAAVRSVQSIVTAWPSFYQYMAWHHN